MNDLWALIIIVVALVVVVGILAWWDAAIQVSPDVATVDALKALAELHKADVDRLFNGCTCQEINAMNVGVKE